MKGTGKRGRAELAQSSQLACPEPRPLSGADIAPSRSRLRRFRRLLDRGRKSTLL